MSDRLAGNLKRRAAGWASKLTRLAKSFAPAHVRPAISSHVEEKSNGEYIIRITADRKVAPDARAWEYGSGEHARRGPKEKYPILPKNKRVLAFYENANGTWDYDMVDPPMPRKHLLDGRGLFRYVMHPGIEAANGGQGYIHPAINELRATARQELVQDVREAIMKDLRESFGRKK